MRKGLKKCTYCKSYRPVCLFVKIHHSKGREACDLCKGKVNGESPHVLSDHEKRFLLGVVCP